MDQLKAAAVEAGWENWGCTIEDAFRADPDMDDERHQALLRRMREIWRRHFRVRETDMARTWRGMAGAVIAEKGWNLPEESEAHRCFVAMVTEATLEAFRIEIERAEGNFGAGPTSKVVLDGLRLKEQAAPAGETILALFECYAAQRLAEKRKRPDTVNQDRKIMEGFAAFVGCDRKLDSIQAVEVREWRDAVAAAPAGYGKRKGYSGLSVREAATKAAREGDTGLSPTTVNKYLSTVSPFFDWCRRNG
jgi:hypothetical protein